MESFGNRKVWKSQVGVRKYKIVFTFGLGRSEPKSLLPLSAAASTAVWEMVGQLSRSRDVHTNQLAVCRSALEMFLKRK